MIKTEGLNLHTPRSTPQEDLYRQSAEVTTSVANGVVPSPNVSVEWFYREHLKVTCMWTLNREHLKIACLCTLNREHLKITSSSICTWNRDHLKTTVCVHWVGTYQNDMYIRQWHRDHLKVTCQCTLNRELLNIKSMWTLNREHLKIKCKCTINRKHQNYRNKSGWYIAANIFLIISTAR